MIVKITAYKDEPATKSRLTMGRVWVPGHEAADYIAGLDRITFTEDHPEDVAEDLGRMNPRWYPVKYRDGLTGYLVTEYRAGIGPGTAVTG